MSGSNALAAAKRRRGGTVDNRGPAPPGSTRAGQPSQSPSPNLQPVNPMQLVMLNHQRLNSIQNELPKAIESLGENFNALSSNCDYLHEQFTSLQEEFQTLKSSSAGFSKSSSTNTVDNERLNKLNEDMSEAHKVASRMQSFSMETNISLSKLRDEYNLFASSVNARLDDLERLMTNTQQHLDNYVIEINNRMMLLEQSVLSIRNGSAEVDESEQVEAGEEELLE